MVKQLPKIRIGDKTYFADYRLRELRNIKNPHDIKDIDFIFFSKSKKKWIK